MTDKRQYASIEEYISDFPANVQVLLENVRQTIRKALPEAKEKIAYNIPTFEINGTNIISFAGWKSYISLYPIPAGDKAFQEKIQEYKKAKSTVQFPLSEVVPYALISKTAIFLKKEKVI